MHRRSCSGERNVPEANLAHLGTAIRWRHHASTLAHPEPTATQQASIDDADKRPDTPGANVLHRHCLASKQEYARNLHTRVPGVLKPTKQPRTQGVCNR
jgi:hypothetical protein